MVRAVEQVGLDPDNGISGQHALRHRLLQPLLDRRMEVLRHAAAENGLGEFQAVGGTGRKLDFHMAVLPMPARLLLVLALNLHLFLDRFTVGYLCRRNGDRSAEAVLQLGGDDVDMHLAQTVDAHLLGLGIVLIADGQVLLQQLGNAGGDLVLVALRFGRNGHTEIRLRELDLRICIRPALRSEGVVGIGIDQLDRIADIAVSQLVGLDVGLAHRRDDAADLLGLPGREVDKLRVLLQRTVHHLEVGLFAERVRHGLKHEQTRRALRRRLDCRRLAVGADDRFFAAVKR